MATITVRQARHWASRDSGFEYAGGPEDPDLKESASQSYAAGAPVYRDTNGTIAVCTATSNVIAKIMGFAMTAATGTTGTSVRVKKIRGGDVLLCNLKGTSTTTTALNQRGNTTHFDLSSGNMVANIDATWDTSKFYGWVRDLYTVAQGYGEGDAVGDTNGRLLINIPDQPGLQG